MADQQGVFLKRFEEKTAQGQDNVKAVERQISIVAELTNTNIKKRILCVVISMVIVVIVATILAWIIVITVE